ncbi:MAG: sodium:solute symporter family transporter [Akkermansiaceae bacterium]
MSLVVSRFMKQVHEYFTYWDWAVVIGYMVLTTWLGHRMSGKQSSIKDFFLGGRKLPWWSVSGSMIATEISALTFIGVPGMVYALEGDWRYLQWGLGSMVARFAVAYWLVPLYYEKEIYSPYDFMGNRLGEGARRLVTGLFSIGSILGQSVRVLVTAIILQVVTGLDPVLCIVIIGVMAVLWTYMGGMQTVIWTDVMQFCLFIFGGLLALFILVNNVGWSQLVELNQVEIDGKEVDKLRWLDFTTPFQDPSLRYTMWVALIAMPFQNFTAFGVDQLNTQRMFCCSSLSDARKAMCWSSVSLLITVLMLSVGAGLFAWYQVHVPSPELAESFTKGNNVFPTWIIMEVPVGLSGLILAGAFAAAISSLDSILAALSQTSLSVIYGREKLEAEGKGEEMVRLSRIAVCVWGVILTLAALALWYVYEKNPDSDLIGLAFGMVAYTYGPLLGVLIAAILPYRSSTRGLVVGTICSVLLVSWFRPELPLLLESLGDGSLAEWVINSRPQWASEWFFPINASLTLLCSLAFGGFRKIKR